ncbi:MAG: hypothetical protein IPG17_07110 [Sandaracinaceae bacterium]|jgi:hypothetical protein|nr:hypothetical protein [Sandaracinaceae bacterium]MBK7152521.1 hypothetical protein [Sandaracinaceae bacterium]MBK7773747.1 hypothetical protein [Sandaracinaceae bacterium]MBK8412774.1 hypothetical protein [Sandaracinaceae bacterium]
MRTPELKAVAASLADAGAPGLPTVVLAREVPVLEVEFAGLEFAVEAKLPASDWATLALARALGQMSPADVDAYLGLGEDVSEGLARRLVDEGLLEERDDAPPLAQPAAVDSGIGGFFRRLFGSNVAPAETLASPVRLTTAARKLRESRASTSPLFRLSAGGAQALERGAVAQRRVRPARLIFMAEPLLFLGVVNEKTQKHTQHRRAKPLEPDRVPEAFRVLDATFGLPGAERAAACGIGESIRGFPGQFVGIDPGTQWEVRQLERRNNGRQEQQLALLIIAGFPSSDADGLHWRAYLRQQEQTQDCPHLAAPQLLGQNLCGLSNLLSTLEADVQLPAPSALRGDGAFSLPCDGALLPSLLGDADSPEDTFLPALAPNWWVGIRAHAMPSSLEAGREAFYAFLHRRDASLRRDFDGTCANVATSLITYWGQNPGLPSVDEAAMNLWRRAELRAALCMRRRHRDLVTPYEREEVAR